MADSNSCALVIRLREEKRVVALPRLKFVDKNLSFQEIITDVYNGDLDVRVNCRVGFKKPGDEEPKDFVSIDLAENVGMPSASTKWLILFAALVWKWAPSLLSPNRKR